MQGGVGECSPWKKSQRGTKVKISLPLNFRWNFSLKIFFKAITFIFLLMTMYFLTVMCSRFRKSVHMNLIESLIILIKFCSKSYHYLISEENRSLFKWLMICIITHFISFIERHIFIVKACLLFTKKFVTIRCLNRYFYSPFSVYSLLYLINYIFIKITNWIPNCHKFFNK